jgi:hypothetical protein
MRRILGTAVMGLLMTTSSAFAADGENVQALAPAATAIATSLAPRTALIAVIKSPAQYQASRRPMLLPALYAGSALLQGYDAYSTLTVLKAGGMEANPMMKAITKSPVAFIGLKAGMATLSIMSAERMWKRGNRIGAVATMVASNLFMGYVAAHNARVVAQVTK